MRIHLLYALLCMFFSVCCSCNGNDGNIPDETDFPCMVSFEKDGSEEYFNVAVRDEYRDYIWYVFRIRHYLDHSGAAYMDLWRIDWAYQGRYDPQTGTMENILDKIITDGESESVIKDYGENYGTPDHIDTYDFTGGFHGDERIDLEEGCGVTFYIDDVPVEAELLSAPFGWKPCAKFHYVQNSTLHKTALKVDGQAVESDHHVIAEHRKVTTFRNSGYQTENRLKMLDELDMYWYSGICCVGTSVAEMGSSGDLGPVAFDRQGGNKLSGTGNGDYYAWSDRNAIEVRVSARMTGDADDSLCSMYIWDTSNYAKFYRRYLGKGPYRTSYGEELSSEMTVRFSVR